MPTVIEVLSREVVRPFQEFANQHSDLSKLQAAIAWADEAVLAEPLALVQILGCLTAEQHAAFLKSLTDVLESVVPEGASPFTTKAVTRIQAIQEVLQALDTVETLSKPLADVFYALWQQKKLQYIKGLYAAIAENLDEPAERALANGLRDRAMAEADVKCMAIAGVGSCYIAVGAGNLQGVSSVKPLILFAQSIFEDPAHTAALTYLPNAGPSTRRPTIKVEVHPETASFGLSGNWRSPGPGCSPGSPSLWGVSGWSSPISSPKTPIMAAITEEDPDEAESPPIRRKTSTK